MTLRQWAGTQFECCKDRDCCEQSNLYIAECGMQFGSYEEWAAHNRKHHKRNKLKAQEDGHGDATQG